jgi:hypothetical protein
MKTAEVQECGYGSVGDQKRLRSKLSLSMLERFRLSGIGKGFPLPKFLIPEVSV